MSEVTEIIGEGDVQLEIVEISGGTIEVIGEDKTTIEIVENTSTANDLDISTQINTVVVDSNPSEGTSLNISEDSPTTIEISSPPVSIDIIDKILVSGTSQLSFNNLVDKPFTVDNGKLIGKFDISGSISSSGTGSFAKIGVGTEPKQALHIDGNSLINAERYYYVAETSSGLGSDVNGNIVLRQNNTDLMTTEGSNVLFRMPITSSQNISSSGLLFISASEFEPPTLRNLEINPGVLVYDTASGRIYYTGSYGGEGSGDATLSFVTSTVSDSLNFNGNRLILRSEAGTFNESGIPTLNVGTSGSVVNFLEAYFFPNDPPTIDNGHLANSIIPSIEEFKPNGEEVYRLIATDPQSTQTLIFSTSSEYTADKFKLSQEGIITLNVLASESLNTDVNNFYDGKLAHKFPIKVEDGAGGLVEEDLYFRILPNQSPQIFNSRNGGNDVTNRTVNLTLYETSSFSESIANSNLSAIEILSFLDPEGDTITIESGSLSTSFENDFKIIIDGNTVKLSQSKAILDFDTTPNYTFQITASDEHHISGLDLESTSSVTYTITVVDNLNPIINPTSFFINEKSDDDFVIGNLISDNVLTDPDGNESNLGATNVTLIGVFNASSPTVSGSNLTGSFGGTSLLDPNEDPISFVSNNITRKSNQFLNVDLINLYKYNLTSINTTTGITGSSGVVSINIENHTLENILSPNQSEGNIIESSRTGDSVVIGSNGLSGTELKIEGNSNTYQNWTVTSSHGDFFEGVTFGTINVNYLNPTTGSQIYIRLKNNISGSNFKSGSIVTCSITASQDDFPTTKQFFEIPVNITINESPTLSLTNNTENWVNTVAIEDTTLVTLTVNDPEGNIINNDSFQLIGNSSTDLSASFIEGNYVIQADNTLAHSTDYNDFEFTASIADEHGFRTSSILGNIELILPTTPTSASNATTDEFIFYAIESSIEGNNVVIDDHGRVKGTQAEITVNFANTENPTNSISSFSIDNNILAISAEGRLLRGNSPFPEEYQIDDIITANITAVDQFRNNIIIPVSVIITENQAPTFTLVRKTTLISPLPSGTHIGDIKNISDAEEEIVTTTVTTPNHTLEVDPTTGVIRKIKLTSTLAQSNTTSDFNITVIATDQFGKSTTNNITIPVAANQPPSFDILPAGGKIASNATSIGTVVFTINNITDPENDSVSLSITNDPSSHSPLSLNASNQAITTQNIPGSTTNDSIFTGNITANDGVNNTIKPFHYVVSGNQAPQFTVNPLANLKFPLNSNDALATITGISDDLFDNVTFTATSNIEDIFIDTNGTSNSTTKYIRLNNNKNQQSAETFTIDVIGSDSYTNQTKKQINFNVAANQPPNTFTITSITLTASISNTTPIATIEGATDIDNETISLSIADPNFSLSSATGPTSNIFYTPGIPGTTLTSTVLEGTVVATDPVSNNVSVSFTNTIAGNSKPFQSFTAEPNLIKPLEKDTLLGTLTYNEYDGETVTFTTSDNITLSDNTAGNLNSDGVFVGSKRVSLKNSNNTPTAETINFTITILDINGNSVENTFSVDIIAAGVPDFNFTLEQPVFKAGEYNADDIVIRIDNINKGNTGANVDLLLLSGAPFNINNNFYLDNETEDSANTVTELSNVNSNEEFHIKVKDTIGGNISTNSARSGLIRLTNGITQTQKSFTFDIKGNDSPSFIPIPQENLVVPIISSSIIGIIENVSDIQSYTGHTFPNDIPFTASVSNTSLYDIVSQSVNDTTNWNVKYKGTNPITTIGDQSLNILITDKYGNLTTENLTFTTLVNNPPTYNVIQPLSTIQSPISQSQVIATIENITDLENEKPYTCSIFTDAEFNTVSTHFIASTGSNADTTTFFITCSTALSERLDKNLNLYVKIEDNFGHTSNLFTDTILKYNILGDNVPPTVTPASFEVNEHQDNGFSINPSNLLIGTDGNSDSFTFGTSSNYTDDYFNVSLTGEIIAKVHLSASYNTFQDPNDGNILKHKLIVTASDAFSSSPDTEILIRIIPNEAPLFTTEANLGSFEEFDNNQGDVISNLLVTDTIGILNNPLTFSTSSTYTNNNLDKIAVNCSSNGQLTFRIKATESMHNNASVNSHEFPITVTDNHGNSSTQNFNFSITPNLPPIFHENSVGGPELNITHTAPNISEDNIHTGGTGHTESIFYSIGNSGDVVTIHSASGTPTDSGSYWDIHHVPELNSIEFRQIGDLEFDSHPTFTFILSASDQHFKNGEDPQSFSPLTLTLNLVAGNDPIFGEVTMSGVNEYQSNPDILPIAGEITEVNDDLASIEAFQFHEARLNATNVTSTYTSILGTNLLNPGHNPFKKVGTEIKRKEGAFLNSDLINFYIYSASIKNAAGNLNSSFITIPINPHKPSSSNTIIDVGNIIESAKNNNKVVTDNVGYGTSFTKFQLFPPLDFTSTGYSFEISSSNDFFHTPNNGNDFELQLKKDLSGSDYTHAENIEVNFTASLIGFETSKVFGVSTISIKENKPPTIDSITTNNDNWNDVDATTATQLAVITISDTEGDSINYDSLTITPTTYLTASRTTPSSNQVFVSAKDGTTLDVANQPYTYNISIKDEHGFSATTTGNQTINLVFGDTGSLTSSSLNMYVLDSATEDHPIISETHGNVESGLTTTVTLDVSYNFEPSSPPQFTTPTATGKFKIIENKILVNDISSLSHGSHTEEIHFFSNTTTPGTGSISFTVVENEGPTITFTPLTTLQHPLPIGTSLGTITVVDPEELGINTPTVSDTTNLNIVESGTSGVFNVLSTSNLEDGSISQTITFNITATDTFNHSTTLSNQDISIANAPATQGTLHLVNSDKDVNAATTFYILETATASVGISTFTPNANPVAINTSGMQTSNKDTIADFLNFYNKDGSQTPADIFQSSFNSDLVKLFDNSNNNNATYMKGDTDLNDRIVHLVYDFQELSALYKVHVRFAGNNNRSNFWTISGSNTTSNPLSSGWTPIAEQNTTSLSNPFDDIIDFTDAANFGNYQYYNISFRDHTSTYPGIKFIQYYTGSFPPVEPIADPVITGSSGIPDITQAAVLSASFIGTSESDPQPTFTTDSTYFNISNSNGLGYLQVNESFTSEFNDKDPFQSTEEINVIITTPATINNGSTTPITINIVENDGPSIILTNQIHTLLGFTENNTLFSLSFNDSEGDYPVNYSISAVSFTGGDDDVIKTEDLTGTVNDSSTIIDIRGNLNLVNAPEGNIAFTITSTDSKGKTSTLSPFITVTGGLIFGDPTLGTNGTAHIIETGVDNDFITTTATGIAGTNLTLSATYNATTAPNVNESLTTFNITSPNYLEVHNTNEVRLKLNGSQELEDLGFDHDSSAQTVTVQITTTKDTGGTYTTNETFSLNITENFPPEIDIDAQTQTLGVNFSGESYMSASVLTTENQVYGFSISDIEGDLPINVEITSQTSNLGFNENTGIGLLSFNSDGTVTTTSTLSTSPGTVSIFPTTVTITPLNAQTINFELTLTDSKQKTQTFSSQNGDFTPIEIQTQPPITVSENIYVYGSKHMISTSNGGGGPITNLVNLYSFFNTQGNTDYEVVMFGDGVVNVPPALTTIVREQTYGVDYLLPTLEVFNNGWVDGNNNAIDLTQFFDNYNPATNPISHRATIPVTEEGVSLNEHFQKHGVIDIGSGQGPNQFIILVPDSPNIEGIPTEMTNAFQQGIDKHVLGISLNPVETAYNEFTEVDTFPWIDSILNSNVHRVEFTTPVDGYTSWFVIGMVGTYGVTSCEIRVQQSTT